jgi:hypothetical protein
VQAESVVVFEEVKFELGVLLDVGGKKTSGLVGKNLWPGEPRHVLFF